LQARNETERALAEYQQVLRLSPARYEPYSNIGRILSDAGQPEAALEYCRTAAKLKPASPSMHNHLGLVLIQLGRFDEASEEFAEALRLDANNAGAHFQLGRTRLKQGRDAEAVSSLREALRLDPNNFSMLIYVARVLAADENPPGRNGAEAVIFASRAAELVGGEPPVVLDTLAAAYAEAGRFAAAVQTQQRALNLIRAHGPSGDEPALRQRLELYQNHQPWRESFRAR
jgi:tetratricopeptide (TPR) repeat protein